MVYAESKHLVCKLVERNLRTSHQLQSAMHRVWPFKFVEARAFGLAAPLRVQGSKPDSDSGSEEDACVQGRFGSESRSPSMKGGRKVGSSSESRAGCQGMPTRPHVRICAPTGICLVTDMIPISAKFERARIHPGSCLHQASRAEEHKGMGAGEQ